jgi:hypothetical protein
MHGKRCTEEKDKENRGRSNGHQVNLEVVD